MQKDTDSSDTLTLRHELKLKKSLTSVSPRSDTLKCQRSVSKVSRLLSVKCQCVELKLIEREVSVEQNLGSEGG